MMKKIVALLAVLAFGLGLAQTAMVRVAHLSPDAPNVDVWVNGAKVEALTNVPFKAVSPYLSLPTGEITVWVVPTGKTEPKVVDAKVKIEAGKMYTIAAAGMLSPAQGQQKFGPQVIVDTLPALAAGKTAIRVIHTSPNAPAVDVALKGGAVLIPALAFPKVSNYLSVDGGTYNLEVRAAGTTTVALPLDGVKLDAGKIYTVFAVGLLGDSKSPLGVVVTVDNQ
jgi:hypothetical protein